MLKQRCFTLKVGSTFDQSELIERLSAGGYVRSEQVDGAGQFSVRGSIVDLFTPNLNNPCRIDFFGDEVDSISLFETDTQRRTDTLKEIEITPATEVFPDSLDEFKQNLLKLLNKKTLKENQRKRITDDIARIENGSTGSFDAYLDLVFPEKVTIFDYLGKESPVFVFDTNAVDERIENCLDLHFEEIKTLMSEETLPPGFSSVYLDKPLFYSKLSDNGAIFCDTFPKSNSELPLKGVFNLNFKQSNGFTGSATALAVFPSPAQRLPVLPT